MPGSSLSVTPLSFLRFDVTSGSASRTITIMLHKAHGTQSYRCRRQGYDRPLVKSIPVSAGVCARTRVCARGGRISVSGVLSHYCLPYWEPRAHKFNTTSWSEGSKNPVSNCQRQGYERAPHSHTHKCAPHFFTSTPPHPVGFFFPCTGSPSPRFSCLHGTLLPDELPSLILFSI